MSLHTEFVVLENSGMDGLLIGTEYHRVYGISIHNSTENYWTIGEEEEIKFYSKTENPNQIKIYSNKDYLIEEHTKPPEKEQWVKVDGIINITHPLKSSRASRRKKESHQ
ncbi:hypothetical protein O181_077176 [Austropuccinia psidii MF-1]|uniref:Uncharacterized protein n=1 Tax=Austropuccinia psidii MF-1 TaxID=1389203 RepID=A0A9Q3IBV3_9BASI|nr:hypothetical protein [Austropuccinia psidii MF-1]